MNKIKKLLLLVTCYLSAFMAKAQGQVEMADQLRSEGKIYVVVAVLVAILAGLIIYLISIDRKLKKLEQLNADES